MIKILANNRIVRIFFILIGMIAVYFTWINAHILYNPLNISNVALRLALRGIITFIPMLFFLLCLHKPSKIFTSLGLNRSYTKRVWLCSLMLFSALDWDACCRHV